MRHFFRRHSLVLIVILFALPLRADDARYEQLLTDLATTQSAEQARFLSGEIWQIWLTAPDEAAQEVLDAAMRRRESHDFLGAITHLDKLVDGWPEYAEGWNQRATLYYLRGEYDKSLADVAETLAREPRHFGALAGKSVILFNQGNVPLAQIAVREALKYHPFLNERAILNVDAGEDI